ncbi:carbohydrate ABC transporter permease [Corynebacterium mendelii]|uniref:Sugar ABC transporter permease n=1 Tax=Corynebacterium mendelii TaxID=2765362 RepID=A0A939DZI5_9CORY|nr:sugar ABC transporter permease [Corynebacterium mendelii]MBN9643706.1 sugar ABC transporter permease [Corynebacterium mendelii]
MTASKKRRLAGFLFVSPAVLLVVALLIYPVLSSIYFSFTNKNLIRVNYDFVGFDNFTLLLSSSDFWYAFVNSVKWTVLSMLGQLLVGLFAALALNRLPRFSGFYRTMLIIPWAFPPIILAFVWKWIFNDVYGFIPSLLSTLGITETNAAPLSNPDIAFWVVLGINIWFGAPLFMVNILSALKTIPQEQYEAAMVDGASNIEQFFYITVNHIKEVIGLLVILRVIWVFNNFDILYLLTGGGPGKLTTTLPIYAYQTGWNLRLLGSASAITVLLLVFLLILASGAFKLLNKWEKERG